MRLVRLLAIATLGLALACAFSDCCGCDLSEVADTILASIAS